MEEAPATTLSVFTDPSRSSGTHPPSDPPLSTSLESLVENHLRGGILSEFFASCLWSEDGSQRTAAASLPRSRGHLRLASDPNTLMDPLFHLPLASSSTNTATSLPLPLSLSLSLSLLSLHPNTPSSFEKLFPSGWPLAVAIVRSFPTFYQPLPSTSTPVQNPRPPPLSESLPLLLPSPHLHLPPRITSSLHLCPPGTQQPWHPTPQISVARSARMGRGTRTCCCAARHGPPTSSHTVSASFMPPHVHGAAMAKRALDPQRFDQIQRLIRKDDEKDDFWTGLFMDAQCGD
jgi:hypothetical protein